MTKTASTAGIASVKGNQSYFLTSVADMCVIPMSNNLNKKYC